MSVHKRITKLSSGQVGKDTEPNPGLNAALAAGVLSLPVSATVPSMLMDDVDLRATQEVLNSPLRNGMSFQELEHNLASQKDRVNQARLEAEQAKKILRAGRAVGLIGGLGLTGVGLAQMLRQRKGQ
jgi:hypothetical protein